LATGLGKLELKRTFSLNHAKINQVKLKEERDMSISIGPLSQSFGAEVIGFNFETNGDEETFQLMRDAWVEHAVICIRHQQITPEYFLKLANIFGEPIPQLINHKKFALSSHPVISILSSGDVDTLGTGKLINRGGSWHTDHSNTPQPPSGTILHAIQLPSQGGNTGFTNQALAYENLSSDMKKRINGLKAKHVYQSKYSTREMPSRSKEDEAISPTSLHPIVRTHPVTGRKSLYLNPVRTETIEDMNETDAQTLLNELLEHSTQDKFQYSHIWKSDDVLLWDNRQTMHSAPTDSHLFDCERRMHRLMIKGDTPF
jgi:taurine dioxygenase